MSTFTLTLKRVIELTGGTTEIVNGITKLTGGDIGIQYYPIFNEAHRDTLTGKIIDHYWNREIGFESIDIFKMKMRTHLNEIMPIYNKLYNSELLAIDPLNTINIHTVNTIESLQHVTAEGENTANTNNTAASRTVQMTTPQVALSPDKDYADGAVDAHSNGVVDSTASEANTSDSETTQTSDNQVTGWQGSQSDLLLRYRETLLNIDLMVINELEQLFMLVFDNGDSYTNSERYYY